MRQTLFVIHISWENFCMVIHFISVFLYITKRLINMHDPDSHFFLKVSNLGTQRHTHASADTCRHPHAYAHSFFLPGFHTSFNFSSKLDQTLLCSNMGAGNYFSLTFLWRYHWACLLFVNLLVMLAQCETLRSGDKGGLSAGWHVIRDSLSSCFPTSLELM